jgi:hypothetical protein
VLVSIVLHGATDAAGAGWIARRAEADRAADGTPATAGS